MPSKGMRKEMGDRVPLRDRQGQVVGYAQVDPEDYDRLMQWRWSLSPRGYAYRRTSVAMVQVEFKMHRVVMNDPDFFVDHINGDPLDNRRENLRVATNAQNSQNRDPKGHGTSGYRGVSFQKDIGRWRAQHTLDGKRHHIGCFDSAEEAGAAAAAWRAEHMPYASEVARA